MMLFYCKQWNKNTSYCNSSGFLCDSQFLKDEKNDNKIQNSWSETLENKYKKKLQSKQVCPLCSQKRGCSYNKLILCECDRPHTKKIIIFLDNINNNTKKQPAYIQDDTISFESGVPQLPVKLKLQMSQ